MEQEFHDKAALQDVISLVGELEHSYRHAIRSAYSSETDEQKLNYSIIANRLREARRKIMKERLGDIDEKDWCLCKSAACLRQISYEIYNGDWEQLKLIEEIVDMIWSKATGEDLSGCQACKNDIEETEE